MVISLLTGPWCMFLSTLIMCLPLEFSIVTTSFQALEGRHPFPPFFSPSVLPFRYVLYHYKQYIVVKENL